jgi:UDP-N-acetylmuramate dehydrogenase
MSIEILKNQSLKPYNSFGIDVYAAELVIIDTLEQLKELLPYIKEKQFMFLGGGSNVLFTKDYKGIIIINKIKGKEIVFQDKDKIVVSALSGELWHEFVLWTLENEAFGLENLSLIPGSVGAAPMQNIGAYGEEINHWCESVEAIELSTGSLKTFKNKDCKFGYRESIFKHELKNQYFIYKVNFSLDTALSHKINCDYGIINDILNSKNISNPNPKDISNAVIEIRSSKLPNPKELGNAGSFFKNPVVEKDFFEEFKVTNPKAPYFEDKKGIKIPAGWLIEQCGFKGKIVENTGSHKNQALVIVNYGTATGLEIFNYSQTIIDQVFIKFGIQLEREVNIC